MVREYKELAIIIAGAVGLVVSLASILIFDWAGAAALGSLVGGYAWGRGEWPKDV